jgi:hypothetical protein
MKQPRASGGSAGGRADEFTPFDQFTLLVLNRTLIWQLRQSFHPHYSLKLLFLPGPNADLPCTMTRELKQAAFSFACNHARTGPSLDNPRRTSRRGVESRRGATRSRFGRPAAAFHIAAAGVAPRDGPVPGTDAGAGAGSPGLDPAAVEARRGSAKAPARMKAAICGPPLMRCELARHTRGFPESIKTRGEPRCAATRELFASSRIPHTAMTADIEERCMNRRAIKTGNTRTAAAQQQHSGSTGRQETMVACDKGKGPAGRCRGPRRWPGTADAAPWVSPPATRAPADTRGLISRSLRLIQLVDMTPESRTSKTTNA